MTAQDVKNMDDGKEFKMTIVDGKPVIQCRTEEIEGPDGVRSVVVHAPSLDVVGKFLSQIKEKGD